jgi:hypothetical protein
MNRRFNILFALIVLAGLSAAGSRAVHAQEIFAGVIPSKAARTCTKAFARDATCPVPRGRSALAPIPPWQTIFVSSRRYIRYRRAQWAERHAAIRRTSQ